MAAEGATMSDIAGKFVHGNTLPSVSKRNSVHKLYRKMLELYISQVRFLLELRLLRKVPQNLSTIDFREGPLEEIRMLDTWVSPSYKVAPSRLSQWKENLKNSSKELVRIVSAIELYDKGTCLNIAEHIQRLTICGPHENEENSVQIFRRLVKYQERIPHLERMKEIHSRIIQLLQCHDAAGFFRKVAVIDILRSDLYKAARLCVYHFEKNAATGFHDYKIFNILSVHNALLRFPLPRLRSGEVQEILSGLLRHVHECSQVHDFMKDMTIARAGIVRHPVASYDRRVLEHMETKVKLQYVLELGSTSIINMEDLPAHTMYKFIPIADMPPFPTLSKLVKEVNLIEDLDPDDGIVYIAFHPDYTVAVAMLSACLTYSRGKLSPLACVHAQGVFDFNPLVDVHIFRSHLCRFFRKYSAAQQALSVHSDGKDDPANTGQKPPMLENFEDQNASSQK